MDFKTKVVKTNPNPVLILGIGAEGKTSLDFMKASGIPGVDFLLPDENFYASDLAGYKLIFLVVGKIDKPASEMAVRLANMAKDASALTIGMVVIPSALDRTSDEIPYSGETESLKRAVDLLMMISTDAFPETEKEHSFRDIHENAHFQIWLAAKTIVDIMTFSGVVGVDFEDVRIVTRGGGYGILFYGQASGEERVKKVVRMTMPALSSLSDLDGNILIYIYYGIDEITLGEIGEIVQFFQNQVNSHGDIIWNCGYDPALKDELRITVIRTGLDHLPCFG